MIGKCPWPEEQIFDYVYKSKPIHAQKRFISHLNECLQCQHKVAKWETIVKNMNEDLQPSPFLQKELQQTFKYAGKQGPKRSKARLVLAAVSSFCILCIVFIIGMFQQEDGYRDVVIDDRRVLPQTLANDLMPDHFHQLVEIVWINDATNEMLVEVDGPFPMYEQNGQLRLIKKINELQDPLVTLQAQEGKVLLYDRKTGLAIVTLVEESADRKNNSTQQKAKRMFYVDFTR